MTDRPKRRARPLLVASAGVATLALAGPPSFTSGNLMAPRPCPPGTVRTLQRQCVAVRDAGVAAVDAGVVPLTK
jgi:hypothetical protein